jgi:hypothetical protein
MTLTHEQSIEQRRQLLELLYECDVASLVSHPEQSDEYKCLVDPLLQMLQERATEPAIRAYFENQIRTHFGSFDCTRARDAAIKVKAWYDADWQSTAPDR